MKKLMVLGGSRYALPVIEAAHRLGIYVITCDYLPDNIAHKYSDEYCNVSIIGQEKNLDAARKLNIDGIMSFACDPGVITAAYVAEQMADISSCVIATSRTLTSLFNRSVIQFELRIKKIQLAMVGINMSMTSVS